MSVRIRIMLLFAAIVLVILFLVCGSVYYFSYTNRVNNIKTRLTNWAVTTGRLLNQGMFNQKLMLTIDASTALAMKDKTVQAYDLTGNIKYIYRDNTADTMTVSKSVLEEAINGHDIYFTKGNLEYIVHLFSEKDTHAIMVAAAYDEDGKTKLRQLRYILLFSFAGGILIAIAAGYFFSKKLLAPLRKIADDVNEISVQNLESRIKTSASKDEWNYLSATLNQLLNRLQQSLIIHRRFISNASHELLTPLTSISSQLEITLTRNRNSDEYRNLIASIYQDVRQLSRLTQTLLEFARASGDPSGLEIDLVRVDEILLAMPAEISKLNPGHIVLLDFEELPEEDEKLLVFGNEDLLFTAIKNIVVNACKYSGNHQATVKLLVHDNIITIIIEDEGKGIPQEELQNIFQPFYRVSDQSAAQGFGLGLALAQQIIKLHKGNITASSVPDKGSIFTIVFPSAGTEFYNRAMKS
ncbi:MAG: HAMP domain-containing histidine kinase [Bacteroidetes bacterium]|nr:HAMP domain-containing histidine kinase [Bacteroidota bacterium]